MSMPMDWIQLYIRTYLYFHIAYTSSRPDYMGWEFIYCIFRDMASVLLYYNCFTLA